MRQRSRRLPQRRLTDVDELAIHDPAEQRPTVDHRFGGQRDDRRLREVAHEIREVTAVQRVVERADVDPRLRQIRRQGPATRSACRAGQVGHSRRQ